jgi:hypothetical protein
MVVPLFGWSAGDIVTTIKILYAVAGAFKKGKGAKSRFSEAAAWLELFASDLTLINEFTLANPDAKCTQNIVDHVGKINTHYASFEDYLQTYDNGLSSTANSISIDAVVGKIKWTLKELNNKVDKLKSEVNGPLLSIKLLLLLQSQ